MAAALGRVFRAALQEVGIYEYRHPLQDAVAYKSRLADIKDTAKAMVTAKTAVTSATSWTVNGSAQKGTAMIREVSRLMLRAYNAEADNCVRTLRPHTLGSAMTRLVAPILSFTADEVWKLLPVIVSTTIV